MPDYNFIARGLPPIDIASPLLQVEQIRRARAQEEEIKRRSDMAQQRYDSAVATNQSRWETLQQQRAEELSRQELDRQVQGDAAVIAALRKIPYAKIQQSGPPPPQVAEVLQRYNLDPAMDEQSWNGALSQAELAVASQTGQAPQQAPGELIRKDLGGGYWVMLQDGKPVGGVQAPRDPTAADKPPAGYRRTADGNLEAIPGGPAAEKDQSSSMNDRQRSGLDMQMDAALMYAANSAGVSREEADRVFAESGADGVAQMMIEKNDRMWQGGPARFLQSMPLGNTILDVANADLIAPKKAGGAGIAMFQNPTGPITNPDFQAGEAQFPQPIYPIEVQAELVRQMLKKKEQRSAPTPEPPRQTSVEQTATGPNGEKLALRNGQWVTP